MDSTGDKGGLSGGVRVSEELEPKVLAGESNREALISATEGKSNQSGNLKGNISDASKKEKESSNDNWRTGEWRVMKIVNRVLGIDESKDWGYKVNSVGNRNPWKGVNGKPTTENQSKANQAVNLDAWKDVNGRPTTKNQSKVNQVVDLDAWKDGNGKPTTENQRKVNQVVDFDAWKDVNGKPTKNQRKVIEVVDLDAWPDVTEEWTSAKGINIKRTVINNNSAKLDLSCRGEGKSLNGNQDLVSREINFAKDDLFRPEGQLIQNVRGEQDLLFNQIVPYVSMETEEVNGARDVMLIPKEFVKYNVSDLVWGKVRSHPWWPGQIFAPSAASDKAKKYFKKDSYLVAYFGDQSFAWTEGSKLMPFPMYFSDMEKQSNEDGFPQAVSSALDETARRVELGLSCGCLAQEVRDKIRFQVVENSGIREESSIRAGGGNVSSATTFSPGDVLQFIGSLATHPRSEHDRLKFTIAKAQLQAYSRWKGFNQLPNCEEYVGLLKDDTQFNVIGEGNDSMEVMEGLIPCPASDTANDDSSKKRMSMAQNGSSRKRKQLSGYEQRPKIKEKFMSVLLSSGSSRLQENNYNYVKRTSGNFFSSAKSHETASSTNKTQSSTGATTTVIDAKLASDGTGKSKIVEIIPADICTPDMVLSELIFAAKRPMQGQDAMIPVVDWLREFRNSICLENSAPADQKVGLGMRQWEQPSQTADVSGFGGTGDSYWTDRIIQSYTRDHALIEFQKPYERISQPEADIAVVAKLDGNKDSNDAVDLDTGNQLALTNEASEEYRPTAMFLKFENLDSVPPVKNLNEIFSRFGALDESKTKIFSKTMRVKVVFRRRKDAEAAYSSAGKYSIFGPSLISYRLRYIQPRSSKKKNEGNNEGASGNQNKEGTSGNLNKEGNSGNQNKEGTSGNQNKEGTSQEVAAAV